MFLVVYFAILMAFPNAQAVEIPQDFYIPRVSLVRAHLSSTNPGNTARFAAAAMVLNFYRDKKIHPRDLEHFSEELRTIKGAAKVFKQVLGYGWYGELSLEQVKEVLLQCYPLFIEVDHGAFVTLVGFNSFGLYLLNPSNPHNIFVYFDQVRNVVPGEYRVATGDPVRKVPFDFGKAF